MWVILKLLQPEVMKLCFLRDAFRQWNWIKLFCQHYSAVMYSDGDQESAPIENWFQIVRSIRIVCLRASINALYGCRHVFLTAAKQWRQTRTSRLLESYNKKESWRRERNGPKCGSISQRKMAEVWEGKITLSPSKGSQADISSRLHFKGSAGKNAGNHCSMFQTEVFRRQPHLNHPKFTSVPEPEPDMIHDDSTILLGLFDDSVNFMAVLRKEEKRFLLLKNFLNFLSDLSTLWFELGDVIPPACLGLIQVSGGVTLQGKRVWSGLVAWNRDTLAVFPLHGTRCPLCKWRF